MLDSVNSEILTVWAEHFYAGLLKIMNKMLPKPIQIFWILVDANTIVSKAVSIPMTVKTFKSIGITITD